MKLGISLIVLGVIGLGQYIYGQLTPLAYEYAGSVPGVGDIWVRDWTGGLVGAVIGAIFLGIGIWRLRHRKIQGTKANRV